MKKSRKSAEQKPEILTHEKVQDAVEKTMTIRFDKALLWELAQAHVSLGLNMALYHECTGEYPRPREWPELVMKAIRWHTRFLRSRGLLIAVFDIRITEPHDLLPELWHHRLVKREFTTLIRSEEHSWERGGKCWLRPW